MEESIKNYLSSSSLEIKNNEINYLIIEISISIQNFQNFFIIFQNLIDNIKNKNDEILLFSLFFHILQNYKGNLSSFFIHSLIIYFLSFFSNFSLIISSINCLHILLQRFSQEIDRKYNDYNEILKKIFQEFEVRSYFFSLLFVKITYFLLISLFLSLLS